jgi:hypothetical protein
LVGSIRTWLDWVDHVTFLLPQAPVPAYHRCIMIRGRSALRLSAAATHRFREMPLRAMFAALVILASSAQAQQSTFSGQSGVISQFVDGDGWQTSVQLNNTDGTPGQYMLSFYNEDASPMTMTTNYGTGTFVWGTIPAHGSITIQTAGTNVALTQGWALMQTIFAIPGPGFAIAPGANITGTVLFYRPLTVSRPTETSEPLDFSLASNWVLPFDQLNGYASGVALVNQSMYEDITVFITCFDEDGNQIVLDSFTLLRGHHVALTLTSKYPLTIGKRGTLNIQASGSSINVLGFHVSPGGNFSSTSPTSHF